MRLRPLAVEAGRLVATTRPMGVRLYDRKRENSLSRGWLLRVHVQHEKWAAERGLGRTLVRR
jgi:hypothetical protein